MRENSKKLAKRIFLVLTVSIVSILLLDAGVLAEQPIFRGDSSSGVAQQTFIIDENNQSGDLKLQFGKTLDEYIKWNDAGSKFQVSNNLDLMGNEISNFRMENLASSPACAAGNLGRIYTNSIDKHAYLCNGNGSWIQIDDGWALASGVLSPSLTTTKVSIGTTTAASPLHVSENDVSTDAAAGVTIEQAGSGDALAQFLLPGMQRWVMGIDNSDGDKFKIGSGALGTADKVSIGSTSVQIGTVTGTATPLLFGLDVKSTTGDPATGQFEGAMYYNTVDNKFRCYQGIAWADCVASDTLDTAFANDPDKILDQNSATNLAVNLTSTGDFVLQDAGDPFATFADDGSISLGKASAATTIGIGTGTGTDTINIGTGGADIINVGTGTAQKTVIIGSSNASTSVSILSSAANGIKLRPAGDDATGTVQIGETASAANPDLLRLGLKSSTGDPAGSAGMMFYNSSNNKFRCHQGGSWTDCLENKVVLAADVTDSSGNCTITNVTGLSFPVVSGQVYHFRFVIDYTAAATTTGSLWSINGPAATRMAYTSTYSLTATSNTFNNASAYNIPAGCSLSSLTAGNIAIIEGMITPSANGTVTARFATENNNSAVVAKAGSYVEWW